MVLPARNLEIKVSVSEAQIQEIRERLLRHLCQPAEEMVQVDHYFNVETGRLKLREIRKTGSGMESTRAELIAYHRPMESSSRWSDYVVVPVPVESIELMLTALTATHGTPIRVEKQRTVGVVGRTRVHLDAVIDLGWFVELETVIDGQAGAAAEAEHLQVIEVLRLDTSRSIAGSYGDLVQAGEPDPREVKPDARTVRS